MQRVVLAALLALSATGIQAEPGRIHLAERVQPADIQVPVKGQSMDQVRAQYGEPAHRRNGVGEPPISVWRYDQFTVYFEHATVLHTVVHHKPAD